MASPLRIAVTGLAGTYPLGGVFWDYMQYVLGFHRMGHDVLYIEDTGNWCYDPAGQTFIESGLANATLLEKQMRVLEPALADKWYFRDAAGAVYGRPWSSVVEFCRTADLFLHISASCWMRDEYYAAKRLAFIDSDPMYTQASVGDYLAGTIDEKSAQRIEMIRRHHVFFTFGENVGHADCRMPTGIFNWIPTRQPIVMDCFEGHTVPLPERRDVLTTVASWEPTEKGPTIDGVAYCGKSVEFRRFIDMPSLTPATLEVAMSGPAPLEELRQRGWKVRPALEISGDPWVYRDYLAHSAAEFSVAKNAYVAGRTGWFSCRSACYLALGVPAIVQDTAFSKFIPCGRGLLAFDTTEQATAAIEVVTANPPTHGAAAREIAREYFASDKVLGRLLDAALEEKGPPIKKEFNHG